MCRHRLPLRVWQSILHGASSRMMQQMPDISRLCMHTQVAAAAAARGLVMDTSRQINLSHILQHFISDDASCSACSCKIMSWASDVTTSVK